MIEPGFPIWTHFRPPLEALNGQAILPISSYPPADALTKVLLATHGPCATPCF